MKKKLIGGTFVGLLITLLFLLGCSERTVVVPFQDTIKAKTQKVLHSRVLNDTFFFSAFPQKIFVLDSILIISDFYNQEKAFHVFNKETGGWLQSFGNKGQGPGELIFPISPYIKKDKQKVVAYSNNLKKEVCFNFYDKNLPFTESKLNNPNEYFIIEQIASFDSDDIFYRGLGSNMRFAILSNNEIRKLTNDYPRLLASNKQEENKAIFNYMPSWAVSPDGTKMVNATYIGGVLEFFEIKDHQIQTKKVLKFNEPKYKIVSGVTPIAISWSEETTFGFQGAYATNDLVYLLLNGGKAADESFFPDKIIVFDWDGNLLIQYNLDKGIGGFSVDEANEAIYAVSFTKSENPQLIMFSFN